MPGGFEVLNDDVSLEIKTNRDKVFHLQVIDNTGHTLYLIANGARNILDKYLVSISVLSCDIFGKGGCRIE